jgi:hypothetical protein
MPIGMPALGAPLDLGLGEMLNAQRKDQVSDEERKRRLGLFGNQMGFGQTGIAALDLGVPGAKRRT